MSVSSRRRAALWGRAAVAAILAASALAACGDDDGPASETTLSSVPEVTTETTNTDADNRDTDSSDEDGSADTSGDFARSLIRAFDGELIDGVWEIDDAGVVDFTVGDNGLELGEVVSYEDWEVRVTEEDPDEIEVEFRRAERRYVFEVEYDGRILEIEQDLDIAPAEPGRFEIGGAAVATIAVEGNSVILTDLEVADGWTVTDQDESDGEVEVDLRRDNVDWTFEAEIDDGELEVAIDFKIEGAFP